MRLPENEEEIDWRGAWLGERGREEFWYRKSENTEERGKKVKVIENILYQSRKYNLFINIFSTLGYKHCFNEENRDE